MKPLAQLAVNLHRVAAIPMAGLRAYVGRVSDEVMDEIRDALFALGFVAPR